MDSKIKKQLLEKYWQGETTPEEEHWLREQLSATEQEAFAKEAPFFERLQQFSKQEPGDGFEDRLMAAIDQKERSSKRLSFYRNYRKIAAALLVLVVCSIAIYNVMNQGPLAQPESDLTAVEEDPQKAFEIAKQSLMLISSKMNATASYTYELDKFDELHQKLQQVSDNDKSTSPKGINLKN